MNFLIQFFVVCLCWISLYRKNKKNNWIAKAYDVLAFFFVWAYPPTQISHYLITHKLSDVWWISYPIGILGMIYMIGSLIAVSKIKDSYETEYEEYT